MYKVDVKPLIRIYPIRVQITKVKKKRRMYSISQAKRKSLPCIVKTVLLRIGAQIFEAKALVLRGREIYDNQEISEYWILGAIRLLMRISGSLEVSQ